MAGSKTLALLTLAILASALVCKVLAVSARDEMRVIIVFEEPAFKGKSYRDLLSEVEAKVLRRLSLVRGVVALIPSWAFGKLKADPRVVLVEPDYVVRALGQTVP